MFVKKIANTDSASTSYGLDSNLVRSCHRAIRMINLDHLLNIINKCSHPIPTKKIDHTHQGINNIFNTSTTKLQGKILPLRPTDNIEILWGKLLNDHNDQSR